MKVEERELLFLQPPAVQVSEEPSNVPFLPTQVLNCQLKHR